MVMVIVPSFAVFGFDNLRLRRSAVATTAARRTTQIAPHAAARDTTPAIVPVADRLN
ncbi:hypothetical protein LNKW23_37870 [Paralimibaculum aggregatum]|uniref:Uncharacterized protein n=1 Tax=Paralimibaculum aggregatum TaxID=3036245 RepID=A0ABQ6LMZ9_9RHOB|nr:hypothetical protein LNKW23_37870 [Limibaculum sp. NKW23]